MPKYKGICNRGNTCYMNSLLQALYMTPEFREVIYNWRYDKEIHGNTKDSIPYQLQKLFASLQTGDAPYGDTKDLIQSFHWDSNESFEQNDVQEFWRVLFEAIELSSEACSKYISQIFSGYYEGYVKCTKCHRESSRDEKYQDIQLTIVDEERKVVNKSIESSLIHFLQPEVLDGRDMYYCDNCKSKQKALKGYRISSFPPILCFQLSRFTFDNKTMSKKKLTEYVGFPLVLNLNRVMRLASNPEDLEEIRKLEQCNPLLNAMDEKPKVEPVMVDKSKETVEKVNNFVEAQGDMMEDEKEIVKKAKSFLKQKTQQEKAAELQKRHNERMKLIKGKAAKKQMNENFFANARQKVDADKGIAFDVAVIKDITPAVVKNSPEKSIEKETKTAQAEEVKQPPVPQLTTEQILKIVAEQKVEFLKEGENVYELYAILIHAGTSYYGHYYIYVKDTETQQWMCFNDTSVSEIKITDIKKTFGDNKKSILIIRTY